MDNSKNNQGQFTPNKFKIKLIGKSYVGKTTFINTINNPKFNIPYEKSSVNTYYKINFKHKHKTDVFYFEEEPEIDFEKTNIMGISSSSYSDKFSGKNHYIALIFLFDVTEKESFDYIMKSYDKIYSGNSYLNILKIIVSNKNDLDDQLKQVKKEDIELAIKKFGGSFYEISSKNSEEVYNIISQIYTKMRDIVRVNEYFYGIDFETLYFSEKEKLMPNYYEILIIGDKDTGKNSLKNKFLYDCSEKEVGIYEYIIPRTINLGGKEIKFDISIKSNNEINEKNNEFKSEFFYKEMQDLDPNKICVLLTYDISNKSSFDNLKKITDEIFDYNDRYKICISILGMKCDLLLDNELEERVKEGNSLAKSLNAHYYIVSTKTGFNVDTAFYDILVQAYNKYHPHDLIPTNNFYKESVINENVDLYSDIHVRNEKPKMKEKDKKKVEKQIEKELNLIKKMKSQKDQTLNNKKKKENDAYANQFKEILKLNFNKILRCPKCWEIHKIQINEINNSIKMKCIHNKEKSAQAYNLKIFMDMETKVPEITQCNFCNTNSTHYYNLDYCYNCQKIVCKRCDNSHKNSAKCKNIDKNKITPFYLIDSFCNIHEMPTKYYCLDCNNYVCENCFEKEHKEHNFKFYDKDYVEALIKENKKLIENTKTCYQYMEKYFNDLIKSLRNRFNELMDIKIKKLSIKESLVRNLELFKNNYNLVESVAELKYDDVKFIKYNANLNWKNKLDIIFDYMGEPLYVKNKNICHRQNIGRPFNILQEIKKQSKEEMEKEKEKEKKEKEEKKEEIKEEIKEEKNNTPQNETKDIEPESLSSTLKIDDILQDNLKFNNSNISSDNLVDIQGNPDDILITDICALSSKYFGISSDDGLLKIYSAYNYTEKPLNTIKEYLPNKGVYSLYKPHKGIHLNYNPLYLIGFEQIKKLIFDNEYKEYKIAEEYKIDNCYISNMIELFNIDGILISTVGQEIFNLYNDNQNKLVKTDITYMINDYKKNKNIVYIEEIGSDKFNIKLEDDKKEELDKNINIEKDRLRRQTIGNKLRKDESKNELENEQKNKKNVYSIIVQLEQDKDTKKINIKSKYGFYKNFEVLGKVSAYHLLVVDKNKENLPTIMYLFDFNKNEFIKRYYLNQNLPVLYHKLENWYKDSPVFLLLDNKMRLTQYYLDNEKTQNIKSLFSLDLKEIITKKNKDDNIILLNVGDNIFLFANNGLIFRINN